MRRMNKKAQIPTLLLPLMALILAAVALYSFVSFKDTMPPQSEFLSEMMQEIEFNEPYALAETKLIAKEAIQNCPSCSEEQLKNKMKDSAQWREEKFYREELGNFFGKLRNKEIAIENKENKITIKIESLFIQSNRGYNKIKRDFAICMVFNNEGKFLNNCEENPEQENSEQQL